MKNSQRFKTEAKLHLQKSKKATNMKIMFKKKKKKKTGAERRPSKVGG